jgi:hypothetical protein
MRYIVKFNSDVKRWMVLDADSQVLYSHHATVLAAAMQARKLNGGN